MGENFVRKYTEDERKAFVIEALEYGSNILVCAKYDINPQLLSKWKNNYRRYGQTLEPKKPVEKPVVINYKKEYQRAMSEIEKKDLEIAVLRDLLKKKTN